MGSQFGESSVLFLKENYSRMGYKSTEDLRVAVIYEDGPYGVSVKDSNILLAKQNKMKVLLVEGYDHKTKDLSALILKLKANRLDAILHTGYYPDIVLFLRQARELGLTTKALLGHGAGYDNFKNLEKQLGPEIVQYIYCSAIAPAQNLNKAKLQKQMGPVIDEYLTRFNQKYKDPSPVAHSTMGFAHSWVLLQTIEQAVKKYGQPTADNIRKAALEMDIAEGGTPAGYGVKFAPPDHKYSGQNLRAYTQVMQWLKGKIEIVYPSPLKTTEPRLPAPADWPLAVK
jgi:branched-chain amino acid transport system substrate-binding protein